MRGRVGEGVERGWRREIVLGREGDSFREVGRGGAEM